MRNSVDSHRTRDRQTSVMGNQVDVILLDFVKASDKVPHAKLLHKLDFYGIRGSLKSWIGSFLSGWKQSVVLDGCTSSEAAVLSGGRKARSWAHSCFWHSSTTCQNGPSTPIHTFLPMIYSFSTRSRINGMLTYYSKIRRPWKTGKRLGR